MTPLYRVRPECIELSDAYESRPTVVDLRAEHLRKRRLNALVALTCAALIGVALLIAAVMP